MDCYCQENVKQNERKTVTTETTTNVFCLLKKSKESILQVQKTKNSVMGVHKSFQRIK
jgi:hypothetical protein